MNKLIEKINACFEALKVDAELQAEKGNKAAGIRARKTSLELEKLLKEFRKTSLQASKKPSELGGFIICLISEAFCRLQYPFSKRQTIFCQGLSGKLRYDRVPYRQ